MPEIAKLAALKGQEINEAKKVLATEATALLHGREAAETGRRDRPHDLRGKARSRPTCRRSKCRAPSLKPGSACSRLFAEKTGLVASNGEARRQVKGGGLKVNDANVTDDKMVLSARTSRRRA